IVYRDWSSDVCSSDLWKRSDKGEALNPDLWKRLLKLTEKHKITYVWVKGHAGHPYNERCDKLATTFADSLKEQEKPT
ncbi:MAG: hypothetical protein IKY00_04705, partial [Clostridia bacterium]|nr:hypothetical protein [Clostridia bacterium]